MKLVFQCNLDDVRRDIMELNMGGRSTPNFPVPRKGESVRIPFVKSGQRYSYDLAIVDVSYDYINCNVIVELHMPALYSTWSIDQWSKWFKAHRYG